MGNNSVRGPSSIDRLLVKGGNHLVKATEVGPVTAHDGRRRDRCAATAASTVLVRGANNSVRLAKLPVLKIVGQQQPQAVVATGRTKVSRARRQQRRTPRKLA